VNKFTVGLNCFEGCNETAAAIRNRFSTRSVRKGAKRGARRNVVNGWKRRETDRLAEQTYTS
jgi:hypothetical protein